MPSNSAGTTSGTGAAQIDPYVLLVQHFNLQVMVGEHIYGVKKHGARSVQQVT